MDITTFVNITSRAWSLAILANMHRGAAGRQAVLLKATGANRTAFSQSMNHLMELGLVERNPGHGHPLRPEFRLTKLGATVGKIAHHIDEVTEFEDQNLIRRMWTVPILTSLNAMSHFNDIKRNLPAITDRALSHSLRSMEERNWVSRTISHKTRPPRSTYHAINTGEKISQIAGPEVSFTA